jgi:hypothetical protein
MSDPPPPFDFEKYLDESVKNNHSFIRLWRLELPTWTVKRHGSKVHWAQPHPWKRVGPGKALDGKPKFDLSQLDPDFFKRQRERAVAAGKRGIYVSIMLFEGWALSFAPWAAHPFNRANNIQGIDGDIDGDGKGTETHTLKSRAVTQLQEVYIRKVIDNLNDLDNVLFEIANESNFEYSKDWQYHLIRFVKDYEKRKPKQHPVGMTGQSRSDNEILWDSAADWISPGSTGHTREEGPYKSDPPAASGAKVVILDTDHIWGTGGRRDWVWKSFLRGYNPIWMDPYGESPLFDEVLPYADESKRALGEARRFADRMDLGGMTPRPDLSSTSFCLANRGSEVLVYQPRADGPFTVNARPGEYAVEWFSPETGKTILGEPFITPGGYRMFKPPFAGEAVLYLKAKDRASSRPSR